jgi:DNA-binding CsgD family transcriptional regulator
VGDCGHEAGHDVADWLLASGPTVHVPYPCGISDEERGVRLAGPPDTNEDLEQELDLDPGRPVLITAGCADDLREARRVLVFDRVLEIGRAASEPGTGWCPADDLLSRSHARVEAWGSGFVVIDAHSKNGTFVDGRRCRRSHVRDGAVVAVGRHAGVLSFASEKALKATEEDSADPFFGLPTFAPGQALAHQTLRALAPTVAPLLLFCPCGVSAFEYAREIHRRSGRRGPLTVLGNLDGGLHDLLAAAAGGTLFVAEVAELPLAGQRSLFGHLELQQQRRWPVFGKPVADVRFVLHTSSPWRKFRLPAGTSYTGLQKAFLAPLRLRKPHIALLRPEAKEPVPRLAGEARPPPYPLEGLVRLLAQEKQLSEREAEVVLWGAGRGLSMKEIASRLRISVKAVEYVWTRVYAKLGCETQLEAGSLLVQRALDARRS